MTPPAVRSEKNGAVTTVILSRPDRRNAVDRPTAEALSEAFLAFDRDPGAAVAVFYGEGGAFCAGADLTWMRAMADYTWAQNKADAEGLAAMLWAILCIDGSAWRQKTMRGGLRA